MKILTLTSFERVYCAQKLGFKNREVIHNTNWSAPPSSKGEQNIEGDWLTKHDPEQSAKENLKRCKRHLVNGTPFENTNAVPGYTHKPWMVKELLSASKRGEPDLDEGDWS